MTDVPQQSQTDYLSPKLEARQHPEKGGYGVFTTAPITAGEVVVVWGGKIVTGEQLEQLPEHVRIHGLQVEENLYQIAMPGRPLEPGDLINHSCDPNVGLSGQIVLIAMRDIAPEEEICFDYAMSDGSPYDEFECVCGAPNCRGKVTGNDWQLPELQVRYRGYFMPYLQRRIDRLWQQEPAIHVNGRSAQTASVLIAG